MASPDTFQTELLGWGNAMPQVGPDGARDPGSLEVFVPSSVAFLSSSGLHTVFPMCDMSLLPQRGLNPWRSCLLTPSLFKAPQPSLLRTCFPHILLYIFAYIFLQPNSAFKGLLFHLLINFYLPRQREDNTGDTVCDVCCSLTTLQMKFPLE